MDIKKGIKLEFTKSNKPIQSDLEVYSSTNRIPFSLKVDYLGQRPSSFYCEVSNGENFIEFWFNKETRQLYEITVVAIQQDTVQSVVEELVVNSEIDECFLDDTSKLEISESIKVLRSDESLQFYWGKQLTKSFTITKECVLGVDEDDNLCALILTNLTKEVIFEILGF